MTTVAANRFVICGDRQATDGCGRKSRCTKIFSKNKCFIGFCGSLTDGEKFRLAWPEVEGLEVDEDFEALILSPKGLWHYDSAMIPLKVEDQFYAIGSGGDLARAAMLAGATPQEAVKIAAKLDSFTGNKIHTRKLT